MAGAGDPKPGYKLRTAGGALHLAACSDCLQPPVAVESKAGCCLALRYDKSDTHGRARNLRKPCQALSTFGVQLNKAKACLS